MPFKKGETPKGAKPFSKEHQPAKNGRKLGVPNRSTILKKWLTAELDILNPVTKTRERGTVEDEVMLALVTRARKGDVPAIKEILDTMYGKLSDKHEHAGEDGGAIEIVVKHVKGTTQADSN